MSNDTQPLAFENLITFSPSAIESFVANAGELKLSREQRDNVVFIQKVHGLHARALASLESNKSITPDILADYGQGRAIATTQLNFGKLGSAIENTFLVLGSVGTAGSFVGSAIVGASIPAAFACLGIGFVGTVLATSLTAAWFKLPASEYQKDLLQPAYSPKLNFLDGVMKEILQRTPAMPMTAVARVPEIPHAAPKA